MNWHTDAQKKQYNKIFDKLIHFFKKYYLKSVFLATLAAGH